MLSYRILGDGPPILLIHGFGISFNIWQNLLPLLKENFSLIMIELPGIGNSPACEGDYLEYCVSEIERLRLELKIERWHVLSYSSGTRVGERYILDHAEHVINAVYLCPAQVNRFRALNLKIAKLMDARFPSFGNWVLSGRRLDFLIRLLGFNLQQSPHARAWVDEIGCCSAEILKQIIHSMPDDGGRPFIAPPVPYLFIWGTRDLITASPRIASARHRLIRATHSAPATEPEQVAELAIPFLSSRT
jgi:pimeloyl-ACP methyl ester carboxylesterase